MKYNGCPRRGGATATTDGLRIGESENRRLEILGLRTGVLGYRVRRVLLGLFFQFVLRKN